MAVAVIGGVFKETGNTLILPVMGWIPLVLLVFGSQKRLLHVLIRKFVPW
jgi:hypothetical protein